MKPEIEALMSRIIACSAPVPEFKIPFTKDLIISMMTSLEYDCVLVIGSSVMDALVADDDFNNLLDPKTRHADLLAGYFAIFLGMSVYTDTYYHPDDKIVQSDRLYMASVNKEDDIVMKSFGVTITTKE